jgi:uncharacterized SAM-binding protein YcdF (DUF218 family)
MNRWLEKWSAHPGVLLLVVAVPAYIAAFFFLRPDVNPVTWESGEIAQHILRGDGFSMHRFAGTAQASANQEPLYPLLLAVFLQRAPAPYITLLIFQVAVWLWSAHLLSRLGRRLTGAPEAITVLVVALWPPLMVYVLKYHPLFLRASALIFAVSVAVAYRDRPSWRRALGLGAALGFAALARAPFLVLPLLLLPWALSRPRTRVSLDDEEDADSLIIHARSGVGARLVHAVLVLAAFSAMLSPWVVRNHRVLDAFVPGTTTAGYTARIGNFPGARGVLTVTEVQRVFRDVPEEVWKAPEPVRDRYFRRQVARFVRERPGEAATLYLKKLLYLWTWRPAVGELYPSFWTPIYLVAWLVLLSLTLAGWRFSRRSRVASSGGLLLAVWSFNSLIYAAFVVNMRLRFESEALLIPLAVVGGLGLIRLARRHPRDAAQIVGSVLGLVLLLGGTVWAFRDWPGRWLTLRDPVPAGVDAALVFSGDPGFRRTRYGATLVREGHASLLVTTGSGVGGDSGSEMASVARLEGVPRDQILVETESTSTHENVVMARPLLEAREVESLALITSPCHQRRAYLVARKELPDLTLINAPVPEPSPCGTGWYRGARGRAAIQSEWTKLVGYFFRGWI